MWNLDKPDKPELVLEKDKAKQLRTKCPTLWGQWRALLWESSPWSYQLMDWPWAAESLSFRLVVGSKKPLVRALHSEKPRGGFQLCGRSTSMNIFSFLVAPAFTASEEELHFTQV